MNAYIYTSNRQQNGNPSKQIKYTAFIKKNIIFNNLDNLRQYKRINDKIKYSKYNTLKYKYYDKKSEI